MKSTLEPASFGARRADGVAAAPAATVPAPAADLERAGSDAVEEALGRVAPAFTLDRWIAVSPYWGWIDHPVHEASARLGALAGSTFLPSRQHHLHNYRQRRFRPEHLRAAIEASGAPLSVDDVVDYLDLEVKPPAPLPLVTDRLDAARDLRHLPSWREVVQTQVSQHCAASLDREQAGFAAMRERGLYAGWRERLAADHGLELLTGSRGLHARVASLPPTWRAVLRSVPQALGLPEHAHAAYFTALLLSVPGWASHCAGLRFSARLDGGDDSRLAELLAIRLAWEWILDGIDGDAARREAWRGAWSYHREHAARTATAHRIDWLLQSAAELAWQEPLCDGLARAPRRAPDRGAPEVQAVFCIDVRSEPMRRALEAESHAIRTIGFAGFFGLPIAFTPFATSGRRAQLPGLLRPAMEASDEPEDPVLAAREGRARRGRLRWRQRWAGLRRAATAAFAYVETLGPAYAATLLRDSTAADRTDEALRSVDEEALPTGADRSLRRAPRLSPSVTLEARVEVAERTLRAMGLTGRLARTVLFVGHGSRSRNNPFAAALDCGACGGHSGEVNARLLAGLLNDDRVREGLVRRGLLIGHDTRFLAGLHDTVTDEITLFEDEGGSAPARVTHLAALRDHLRRASARVRRERASSLGLAELAVDDAALLRALEGRARDWAEVRPEWGLAGNAAMVIAPRERTAHLDLGGRVFLHDYRAADDPGFALLEGILTAPLLVAHWINAHYHGATVDNARFGSGDKLLHNVVGGNLGVFEGATGDLRTGLPWQSIHDGERLRHEPLRLSVFVEAPRHAIDGVLARHEVVRRLVVNGWIHLFQIEQTTPEQARLARRGADGWSERTWRRGGV